MANDFVAAENPDRSDHSGESRYHHETHFPAAAFPHAMSLDDLTADVESTYDDLEGDLTLDLDEETRRELTMLQAALDADDSEEIVKRALHLFFQSTVESGRLDFHLRSTYDVTYDEYLSGMTYDEMTGADQFPQPAENDDRRYQF
ncbi:hypothetical protein GCM10028857_19900 [Salinarchaeum chitinilyticum]